MKPFLDVVRGGLVFAVLLAALGYAALAYGPTRAVAQAPSSAPFYVAERHPEIRAALRHLRQAQGNLARGAHDFGGHRAAALNLVNQAIDQCQQALQYDRH